MRPMMQPMNDNDGDEQMPPRQAPPMPMPVSRPRMVATKAKGGKRGGLRSLRQMLMGALQRRAQGGMRPGGY